MHVSAAYIVFNTLLCDAPLQRVVAQWDVLQSDSVLYDNHAQHVQQVADIGVHNHMHSIHMAKTVLKK